jgi:hypothetical protein
MRQILLCVLVATVFSVQTDGQEAGAKERALALLKPKGKHVFTEAEAKEVAALGEEVLPIVYDALFKRGEFGSGVWAREALRVLAHTRNENVMPQLKAYLESKGDQIHRFEAMAALLEVSNTTETRQYVVDTTNAWIIPDRWRLSYDIEGGLARLADANIPDADRIRLFADIRLADFRVRIHPMRHLALRANAVTTAILKGLLGRHEPSLTRDVGHAVEDAIESHRRVIQDIATFDEFMRQSATKKDVEREDAEHKAAIAVLENEFNVISIYQEAADGGDREALFELGDHYLAGKFVEKDPRKAVLLLEQAAQKGQDMAIFRTACCYLDGVGVEKQPEKGFGWMLKSAQANRSEACYLVGLCYRDGNGTAVDMEQAKAWLKKAAGWGHALAKAALGEMKE